MTPAAPCRGLRLCSVPRRGIKALPSRWTERQRLCRRVYRRKPFGNGAGSTDAFVRRSPGRRLIVDHAVRNDCPGLLAPRSSSMATGTCTSPDIPAEIWTGRTPVSTTRTSRSSAQTVLPCGPSSSARPPATTPGAYSWTLTRTFMSPGKPAVTWRERLVAKTAFAEVQLRGAVSGTRQFGSPETEQVRGVAVDASKNMFITGATSGDLQGANLGNDSMPSMLPAGPLTRKVSRPAFNADPAGSVPSLAFHDRTRRGADTANRDDGGVTRSVSVVRDETGRFWLSLSPRVWFTREGAGNDR